MDRPASRRSRSRTWPPIASSCAPGSTRPPRCSASPMKRRGRTRSACCSRKARSPTCCAPRSPSRTAATARRCWSAARTSTTCWRSSGVDESEGLRGAQQPQFAAGRPRGRLHLRQAPAARHAAPRDRADGQPGPQHLRRGDARAGRGRRDDHRHDPAVQPVAAAGAHGDRRRAGRDPVRRSTSSSAGTRPC